MIEVSCEKCLAYANSQPYILEACASVGIEHDKSTEQMLKEYLAYYHKRKHKE